MVSPRGNINSPIWAIQYEPSDSDKIAGTLLSGSEGYHFDKMLKEIGLPEPYVTCVKDNVTLQGATDADLLKVLIDSGSNIKPNIILAIGSKINEFLCSETRNYKKPFDCKLDKWSGSILSSNSIPWPHYVVPLWEPSYIFMDWSYRDIYKFIDLGHAKDAYDYYTANSTLLPLPNYNITTNPTYPELLSFLSDCRSAEYLSVDIETIRPTKGSKLFKGHPGYLYTFGIAPNSKRAVSFCLWRYSRKQTVRIFQELDYLFRYVPQIGQNYFSFDTHFMESYGWKPCLERCQDTRIRHHILWPELPHSLQFLTKQYTHQKFYKDEGKTWKPSQLDQLLRYNALDAVVTYEVFEKQEEEFKERPHLI